MEAMRSHGMSVKTVQKTFLDVINAINDCNALAIVCNNDRQSLQERASGFEQRSEYSLFQYCTGAVL